MIRNFVETEFLPRIGLAVGTFLLWAVLFLTLVGRGASGTNALVALPVLLTSILFGIRGAVIGSAIGVVGLGGLQVIAGTGSFDEVVRGSNPINLVVLMALAMMVGYVRRFRFSDRPSFESETIVSSVIRQHQQELRRTELAAIAAEFNSLVHTSLEISEVSRCVIAHISRALRPDFMAIAVTDVEYRKIRVEQAIGLRVLGYSEGDIRSISESLTDSMTNSEIIFLNESDLAEVGHSSHFAATAIEAGVRSVLAANFRNRDNELITRLWVCSTAPESYSDLEFEFVSQISGHLKSAVRNARNAESLKRLQQYLVGQNESFAQMQDSIENTEGALRLSNEQLTELSEAKTQFMSEVAHEIKSPLAVMIGYADLLRFDVENMNAENREFAASIEKAARQLVVLIDDLSDISNIVSGHFTTTKEPHDAVKVMCSVVEGLRVSNPEYKRRLVVTGSMPEFEVEGDPARLSQVFTNLVTNALKYSSEDKRVEVSATDIAGRVRLSVVDLGMGISDEDLEKMFTPYFRSTNPEVRQRPGTGLGLFLSKSIVEEHGGTLTVSSEVGVGSTFTVELPGLSSSFVSDAA